MQNRKGKKATISFRLMTILSIIGVVISIFGFILAFSFLGNALNETVNYRIFLSAVLGFSYLNLAVSLGLIIATFLYMKDIKKKYKEICRNRLPSKKVPLLQVGSIILLIVSIVVFLIC